jgi:hypothetical protein
MARSLYAVPQPITITAANARTLMEQLDAAVETTKEMAMVVGGHGILITRRGYDAFTVAISSDVPYGFTYERQEEAEPEATSRTATLTA